MKNKEKVITLSLITALIMTLVFASLNVTYIGATDGGSGTTMTFNSNVTLKFETGNTTWIGSGNYTACYNETKGENITEIKPGNVFKVDARPGWDLVTPEPGTWWYVYTPQLYGLYIAFLVDDVYGPPGSPVFNISETWGYWPGAPMNFTIDPPLTYFEAEQMLPTIETGVDYMAFVDFGIYNVMPEVDSWWKVTAYPSPVVGVTFNISYVDWYWDDPVTGDKYYYVRFDELRNATGDVVDTIDSLYTPPLPIEGIEAIQLITAVEPTEYYISSPACLLPEDSWWNITYPDELSETQFHVDFSEEKPYIAAFRSYMNIDNVMGLANITLPGVEYVEAIWADAPSVATIGSWYKVIDGPSPEPWTCWNVTTSGLEGTKFCIDRAGEGVFHIDEVVNATGTPGPVTVDPPVASVTAEQFIPKIYAEVSPYSEGYGEYKWNFSVSIKTDYIFHVWSYEFTLTWDPNVLNLTSVTNGDLIVDGTATYVTLGYDNTAGELSLTGAYFSYTTPPAPQTHGPGTLAIVNLTLVGEGTPLAPALTFGLETRLIGVTDEGYGEKYNAIDDITGQIIDPPLKAKMVGDIDGNWKVDPFDYTDFRVAFGSKGPPQVPVPEANYNPQADFNLDGDVDPFDYTDFRVNFGRTLP